MGLFDFLPARRLRGGPTLLLPASVPPRTVLETVRLHSPQAHPRGRSIVVDESVRLRGPVPVHRGLALAARLPVGWPVAYTAEQRDPEGETDPAAIVAGLAARLGGLACPHPPERSPDLFSVTGRALPAERLAELLPGTRPQRLPGIDLTLLRSGHSPLEISFCGGDDGETDYEVSLRRGPSTPAVVEAAERLAIAIAEASGGVLRDQHGFRVPLPVRC
ncbi:hypothetical protein [Planomonospora venezuelensis]|uniref:Uncharacterized protein n=1 Tax=Planomonospora venezuelensis TaxID=1999 RepID=A0A841D1J4_PLAVE|nr:hypothetical protein [Planomonospora venezuelensis]MBB5964542.1 hypothetical protein [Planomonospora venezuelensis]